MSRIPNIYLSILLALGSMTHGAAQKTAQVTKGGGQEKVNLYKRYDKSKDETVIKTESMLIYGAPSSVNGLHLSASYAFPGKVPRTPTTVTLIFQSGEGKYQFDRNLVIKADDEVFQPGAMSYDKLPRDGFLGISEVLKLSVPTELLIRIVNSTKVHVRLGTSEFDLTEKHLENLRALASTLR